MAAAWFKVRYAISYADAFAASTAADLGAFLVTGDPELQELGNQILMQKLERNSAA